MAPKMQTSEMVIAFRDLMGNAWASATQTWELFDEYDKTNSKESKRLVLEVAGMAHVLADTCSNRELSDGCVVKYIAAYLRLMNCCRMISNQERNKEIVQLASRPIATMLVTLGDKVDEVVACLHSDLKSFVEWKSGWFYVGVEIKRRFLTKKTLHIDSVPRLQEYLCGMTIYHLIKQTKNVIEVLGKSLWVSFSIDQPMAEKVLRAGEEINKLVKRLQLTVDIYTLKKVAEFFEGQPLYMTMLELVKVVQLQESRLMRLPGYHEPVDQLVELLLREDKKLFARNAQFVLDIGACVSAAGAKLIIEFVFNAHKPFLVYMNESGMLSFLAELFGKYKELIEGHAWTQAFKELFPLLLHRSCYTSSFSLTVLLLILDTISSEAAVSIVRLFLAHGNHQLSSRSIAEFLKLFHHPAVHQEAAGCLRYAGIACSSLAWSCGTTGKGAMELFFNAVCKIPREAVELATSVGDVIERSIVSPFHGLRLQEICSALPHDQVFDGNTGCDLILREWCRVLLADVFGRLSRHSFQSATLDRLNTNAHAFTATKIRSEALLLSSIFDASENIWGVQGVPPTKLYAVCQQFLKAQDKFVESVLSRYAGHGALIVSFVRRACEGREPWARLMAKQAEYSNYCAFIVQTNPTSMPFDIKEWGMLEAEFQSATESACMLFHEVQWVQAQHVMTIDSHQLSSVAEKLKACTQDVATSGVCLFDVQQQSRMAEQLLKAGLGHNYNFVAFFANHPSNLVKLMLRVERDNQISQGRNTSNVQVFADCVTSVQQMIVSLLDGSINLIALMPVLRDLAEIDMQAEIVTLRNYTDAHREEQQVTAENVKDAVNIGFRLLEVLSKVKDVLAAIRQYKLLENAPSDQEFLQQFANRQLTMTLNELVREEQHRLLDKIFSRVTSSQLRLFQVVGQCSALMAWLFEAKYHTMEGLQQLDELKPRLNSILQSDPYDQRLMTNFEAAIRLASPFLKSHTSLQSLLSAVEQVPAKNENFECLELSNRELPRIQQLLREATSSTFESAKEKLHNVLCTGRLQLIMSRSHTGGRLTELKYIVGQRQQTLSESETKEFVRQLTFTYHYQEQLMQDQTKQESTELNRIGDFLQCMRLFDELTSLHGELSMAAHPDYQFRSAETFFLKDLEKLRKILQALRDSRRGELREWNDRTWPEMCRRFPAVHNFSRQEMASMSLLLQDDDAAGNVLKQHFTDAAFDGVPQEALQETFQKHCRTLLHHFLCAPGASDNARLCADTLVEERPHGHDEVMQRLMQSIEHVHGSSLDVKANADFIQLAGNQYVLALECAGPRSNQSGGVDPNPSDFTPRLVTAEGAVREVVSDHPLEVFRPILSPFLKLGRLPKRHELLWCGPHTSVYDLQSMMDRAAQFAGGLFMFLGVNQLSGKACERLFELQKSLCLTRSIVVYVWFDQRTSSAYLNLPQFDKTMLGKRLEEAEWKQKMRQLIQRERSSALASVVCVTGQVATGKTYEIRRKLQNDVSSSRMETANISINNEFMIPSLLQCLAAASNSDRGVAVHLNISQHAVVPDREMQQRALEEQDGQIGVLHPVDALLVNTFIFDLLVLGSVGDLTSGMVLTLSGQPWKFYIEAPSDTALEEKLPIAWLAGEIKCMSSQRPVDLLVIDQEVRLLAGLLKMFQERKLSYSHKRILQKEARALTDPASRRVLREVLEEYHPAALDNQYSLHMWLRYMISKGGYFSTKHFFMSCQEDPNLQIGSKFMRQFLTEAAWMTQRGLRCDLREVIKEGITFLLFDQDGHPGIFVPPGMDVPKDLKPCLQGALEELEKYRMNPMVEVRNANGRKERVNFKESEGLHEDVSELHALLSRVLQLSAGTNGAREVHQILKSKGFILRPEDLLRFLLLAERRKAGLPVVITSVTGVGKSFLLETLSLLSAKASEINFLPTDSDFHIQNMEELAFSYWGGSMVTVAEVLSERARAAGVSAGAQLIAVNRRWLRDVSEQQVLQMLIPGAHLTFRDVGRNAQPHRRFCDFLVGSLEELIAQRTLQRMDVPGRYRKYLIKARAHDMILGTLSEVWGDVVDNWASDLPVDGPVPAENHGHPLGERLRTFIEVNLLHRCPMMKAGNDLVHILQDKMTRENTKQLAAAMLDDLHDVSTFSKLLVHPGLSEEDYRAHIRPTAQLAQNEPGQLFDVFYDEANCSSRMSFFSNLVKDRMLDGKILPDNVFFVCAINPRAQGYNVNSLPPSLQELCVEFSSMHAEADILFYIKQSMKLLQEELSRTGRFDVSHVYQKLFADMLSRAHMHMLHNGDTVTQRDIQRAFKIIRTLIPLYHERFHRSATDSILNSVILSIGYCYYLRLSYDKRFTLGSELDKLVQEVIPELFDTKLGICISDWVARENFVIQPGIALYRPLQENILGIVLSVLTRVPIAIVGKPGSGKTLAMLICCRNLRGEMSETDFCKNYLPALDTHFIHGSKGTTSNDIQASFEQAIMRSKSYAERSDGPVVLVFLDEASLPSSKAMVLKILHPYLDDCQVSFVCCSNDLFDEANQNRMITLLRPGDQVSQLGDRAVGCLGLSPKALTESGTNPIIKQQVNALCRAFARFQAGECGSSGKIHHDRDFTYLLRYLHVHSGLKQGLPMTPLELFSGLEENFSGGSKEDFHSIVELFFNEVAKSIGEFELPRLAQRRDALAILRSALQSRKQDGVPLQLWPRFQMVIDPTEDCAAARLLLEWKVLPPDARVLHLSDFDEDRSKLAEAELVSEIRYCMEAGKCVVLQNCDRIYGYLYDLLNLNWREMRDEAGKVSYYVSLPIGASTYQCSVHPDFRVIAVMELGELAHAKAPLLSRFEKQVISPALLLRDRVCRLPAKDQTSIEAVHARAMSFVEHFGGAYLIGYTPSTIDCLLLRRLQDDSPDFDSQAFPFIEVGAHDATSADDQELLFRVRCVCGDLLQLATPETVVLRRKTMPFVNQYFQQVHFGLRALCDLQCNSSPRKWLVMTRMSSEVVQLLREPVHILGDSLKSCWVHSLANMPSRASLQGLVAKFWRSLEHRTLILVAEVSSDSVSRLNLVRQIIDAEWGHRKSIGHALSKGVLLLLAIPPMIVFDQCVYPANPILSWEAIFLDSLHQSDMSSKLLTWASPKVQVTVNVHGGEPASTTLEERPPSVGDAGTSMMNDVLWDFCSRMRSNFLPEHMACMPEWIKPFYSSYSPVKKRHEVLSAVLEDYPIIKDVMQEMMCASASKLDTSKLEGVAQTSLKNSSTEPYCVAVRQLLEAPCKAAAFALLGCLCQNGGLSAVCSKMRGATLIAALAPLAQQVSDKAALPDFINITRTSPVMFMALPFGEHLHNLLQRRVRKIISSPTFTGQCCQHVPEVVAYLRKLVPLETLNQALDSLSAEEQDTLLLEHALNVMHATLVDSYSPDDVASARPLLTHWLQLHHKSAEQDFFTRLVWPYVACFHNDVHLHLLVAISRTLAALDAQESLLGRARDENQIGANVEAFINFSVSHLTETLDRRFDALMDLDDEEQFRRELNTCLAVAQFLSRGLPAMEALPAASRARLVWYRVVGVVVESGMLVTNVCAFIRAGAPAEVGGSINFGMCFRHLASSISIPFSGMSSLFDDVARFFLALSDICWTSGNRQFMINLANQELELELLPDTWPIRLSDTVAGAIVERVETLFALPGEPDKEGFHAILVDEFATQCDAGKIVYWPLHIRISQFQCSNQPCSEAVMRNPLCDVLFGFFHERILAQAKKLEGEGRNRFVKQKLFQVDAQDTRRGMNLLQAVQRAAVLFVSMRCLVAGEPNLLPNRLEALETFVALLRMHRPLQGEFLRLLTREVGDSGLSTALNDDVCQVLGDWVQPHRPQAHEAVARAAADRMREYEEMEQWKAARCRRCPHCTRVVEKLDGCDTIVCGQNAHVAEQGENRQPGCGRKFNFSTAPPYLAVPPEHVPDLPEFNVDVKNYDAAVPRCFSFEGLVDSVVLASAREGSHVACIFLSNYRQFGWLQYLLPLVRMYRSLHRVCANVFTKQAIAEGATVNDAVDHVRHTPNCHQAIRDLQHGVRAFNGFIKASGGVVDVGECAAGIHQLPSISESTPLRAVLSLPDDTEAADLLHRAILGLLNIFSRLTGIAEDLLAAGDTALDDLAVGDNVMRKEDEAIVVKIDRTIDPPSYIVRLLADGREVGTERAHLQKLAPRGEMQVGSNLLRLAKEQHLQTTLPLLAGARAGLMADGFVENFGFVARTFLNTQGEADVKTLERFIASQYLHGLSGALTISREKYMYSSSALEGCGDHALQALMMPPRLCEALPAEVKKSIDEQLAITPPAHARMARDFCAQVARAAAEEQQSDPDSTISDFLAQTQKYLAEKMARLPDLPFMTDSRMRLKHINHLLNMLPSGDVDAAEPQRDQFLEHFVGVPSTMRNPLTENEEAAVHKILDDLEREAGRRGALHAISCTLKNTLICPELPGQAFQQPLATVCGYYIDLAQDHILKCLPDSIRPSHYVHVCTLLLQARKNIYERQDDESAMTDGASPSLWRELAEDPVQEAPCDMDEAAGLCPDKNEEPAGPDPPPSGHDDDDEISSCASEVFNFNEHSTLVHEHAEVEIDDAANDIALFDPFGFCNAAAETSVVDAEVVRSSAQQLHGMFGNVNVHPGWKPEVYLQRILMAHSKSIAAAIHQKLERRLKQEQPAEGICATVTVSGPRKDELTPREAAIQDRVQKSIEERRKSLEEHRKRAAESGGANQTSEVFLKFLALPNEVPQNWTVNDSSTLNNILKDLRGTIARKVGGDKKLVNYRLMNPLLGDAFDGDTSLAVVPKDQGRMLWIQLSLHGAMNASEVFFHSSASLIHVVTWLSEKYNKNWNVQEVIAHLGDFRALGLFETVPALESSVTVSADISLQTLRGCVDVERGQVSENGASQFMSYVTPQLQGNSIFKIKEWKKINKLPPNTQMKGHVLTLVKPLYVSEGTPMVVSLVGDHDNRQTEVYHPQVTLEAVLRNGNIDGLNSLVCVSGIDMSRELVSLPVGSPIRFASATGSRSLHIKCSDDVHVVTASPWTTLRNAVASAPWCNKVKQALCINMRLKAGTDSLPADLLVQHLDLASGSPERPLEVMNEILVVCNMVSGPTSRKVAVPRIPISAHEMVQCACKDFGISSKGMFLVHSRTFRAVSPKDVMSLSEGTQTQYLLMPREDLVLVSIKDHNTDYVFARTASVGHVESLIGGQVACGGVLCRIKEVSDNQDYEADREVSPLLFSMMDVEQLKAYRVMEVESESHSDDDENDAYWKVESADASNATPHPQSEDESDHDPNNPLLAVDAGESERAEPSNIDTADFGKIPVIHLSAVTGDRRDFTIKVDGLSKDCFVVCTRNATAGSLIKVVSNTLGLDPQVHALCKSSAAQAGLALPDSFDMFQLQESENMLTLSTSHGERVSEVSVWVPSRGKACSILLGPEATVWFAALLGCSRLRQPLRSRMIAVSPAGRRLESTCDMPLTTRGEATEDQIVVQVLTEHYAAMDSKAIMALHARCASDSTPPMSSDQLLALGEIDAKVDGKLEVAKTEERVIPSSGRKRPLEDSSEQGVTSAANASVERKPEASGADPEIATAAGGVKRPLEVSEEQGERSIADIRVPKAAKAEVAESDAEAEPATQTLGMKRPLQGATSNEVPKKVAKTLVETESGAEPAAPASSAGG